MQVSPTACLNKFLDFLLDLQKKGNQQMTLEALLLICLLNMTANQQMDLQKQPLFDRNTTSNTQEGICTPVP